MRVADLFVGVKADLSDFRRGMKELNKNASATASSIGKSLSQAGNDIEKTGLTMGQRFSAAMTKGVKSQALQIGAAFTAGFAAVKIVDLLGDSIAAASDLNEEISKSAVVFGAAATKVQDFAEGATAIGLSKEAALQASGAFGNMFNTVGLAQKASADMSLTMVQLASDMASFNNEDPTEMLDRLRSGLAGEAEPLRRFGVLLSEAEVKAFAYRTGIAKSGQALTEAQKVQARYGLILEQTTIQQGDFARTSDGMANTQRQLSAEMQNVSAELGEKLLPLFLELATFAKEELVPALGDVIEVVTAIPKLMRDAGDAVKAFLGIPEEAGPTDWLRDWMDAVIGRDFAAPADQAGLLLREAMVRKLTESAPEIETAAGTGITEPIANAAKAARLAAVAEAFKMPGEIAQAILDGRDVVLGAASGLAAAATDPLLQQAKITEIREQMKDLANVTAEELKAATPATIAADKLKYAQLEIELAGYLLRADPKSKEAMQLLAKYAKSEEPATKAAYDALMSAVEARATVLANDLEAEAERAGISVEEALVRHKDAAGTAAMVFAKGVKDAMHFDATEGGAASAQTFIDGLRATLTSLTTVNKVHISLTKLKALTLGGSLPKAGPFAHPETGAISVAHRWLASLGAELSRGLAGMGTTLPAFGSLSPTFAGTAFASAGVMSTSGSAGGGDTYITNNNNNLTVMGKEPVVSTAAEIAEQAARLGRFKG